MVGWDRSNAPLRSHTHASPPSREATSDISRSRTGSASAFSSGATCSACSMLSGAADSGAQHAAVSAGLITVRGIRHTSILTVIDVYGKLGHGKT